MDRISYNEKIHSENQQKEKLIMYKVLVFGMTENPGGVESFLLNYYRRIDRTKIQFDFLCNSYDLVAHESELISLGGHTFHFPARSKSPREYRNKLEDFFREHAKEYQAIWENVSSLANIDYLKMAKKYGIPKRIIHSHNSQNMDNKLRGILHKWNKKQIKKYATDFWACSEDAAKWFYTEDILPNAVIIHNAIDVECMAYDEQKREEYRHQLKCEDKFVVGNVGRLHFQKNQSFLLDIFYEILKKDAKAELVLVGQGEDEKMLKDKAKELKISDHVHFVGIQYDIPGWLSMFDLFLFPSAFEGLGIAGLEAESNGIPVLASASVIPEEVKMNRNFIFYSLDKPAEKWAQQALDMRTMPRLGMDEVKENFVKNGYDISTEVKKMEKLFL